MGKEKERKEKKRKEKKRKERKEREREKRLQRGEDTKMRSRGRLKHLLMFFLEP